MVTAARDRLARTLRGDVQTAFSVELTVPAGRPEPGSRGIRAGQFPGDPRESPQAPGLGQPARFGRGEQTLTDPDVRDTWEIPKHLVRASGTTPS